MEASIELTRVVDSDVSEGWHPEMSAEEYHAIALPSSSLLSRLRKSPLHCKTAMDTPNEQTKAMRIGSAFHCLVLEPDTYEDRYVVQPEFSGTGSVAARNEWKAANSHKTILSVDESYVVTAMAGAVLANPTVRKLLAAATARELSGIFRHATGERCKVRIDALLPEYNATLDLKSCADASPEGFRWQAVKYGMHRQGAIYADACEALGTPAQHHIVVAVENKAPWAVAIYRISDQDMERGRKEYTELLKLWASCAEEDHWPGYSSQIQELTLPLGHANEDEEDVAWS